MLTGSTAPAALLRRGLTLKSYGPTGIAVQVLRVGDGIARDAGGGVGDDDTGQDGIDLINGTPVDRGGGVREERLGDRTNIALIESRCSTTPSAFQPGAG